jgi:hypothetical protein
MTIDKDYEALQRRLAAMAPELKRSNSKYMPKLSFDERCAVLAAYKNDFGRRLLAKAFGINRATVSYIVRPESSHYKSVRKEYRDLGHKQFTMQYLTPSVLEILDSFKDDPELQLTDDQVTERQSEDRTKPNRKAVSRAGRHAILYHSGTIHVEVKWFDDPCDDPGMEPKEREPGWYVWVDPSSPAWDEGGWEHGVNPPTPSSERFTSKTALDFFLSAIGGEILDK